MAIRGLCLAIVALSMGWGFSNTVAEGTSTPEIAGLARLVGYQSLPDWPSGAT